MSTLMLHPTEQSTDETSTQSHLSESENCNAESVITDTKTLFTAVDMWNRNRQRRSASTFLRKWDMN